MLLFFTVSGIWQTLGARSSLLNRLTTIHTSHMVKSGEHLTSPLLVVFILLMASSFMVTTILGVAMAIRFGRSRRAAFYCLAAGIVIPLILVLLAATR